MTVSMSLAAVLDIKAYISIQHYKFYFRYYCALLAPSSVPETNIIDKNRRIFTSIGPRRPGVSARRNCKRSNRSWIHLIRWLHGIRVPSRVDFVFRVCHGKSSVRVCRPSLDPSFRILSTFCLLLKFPPIPGNSNENHTAAEPTIKKGIAGFCDPFPFQLFQKIRSHSA